MHSADRVSEADGCAGKYTVGLGQTNLAYFDDREDIGSVLLNAVAGLPKASGLSDFAARVSAKASETLAKAE